MAGSNDDIADSRWGKAAFRGSSNKELVMPVDCFSEIECAPSLDTPGTHVQGHILCDRCGVGSVSEKCEWL